MLLQTNPTKMQNSSLGTLFLGEITWKLWASDLTIQHVTLCWNVMAGCEIQYRFSLSLEMDTYYFFWFVIARLHALPERM